MSVSNAALPVRNADVDVLHHALVLMVQDVAVQDELADIALVPRPDDDLWQTSNLMLIYAKPGSQQLRR